MSSLTTTALVRPSLRSGLIAAAIGLAGVLATAQASAESALPAWKTSGELQYSCGGIGVDESTAMRAAMKNYPLALLFAAKNGDYLADVKVDIASGGKNMQMTASGPVCLLKLPAGDYTVKATAEGGATQSEKVQVGKGAKTLDFRF